jgi:hypothetical protein
VFPSTRPRRVSVWREQHGAIVVHIARSHDWLMYIFMLAAFTAAFLFFAFTFISPLFQKPVSSGDLVLLLPVGFILLWYFGAVRIGMWRAFGVERIVIDNGMFLWTRTALFWKRKLELPVTELAAIETKAPWHDLSNHVGFAARGKRYRIGGMLRRDETRELAEVLRSADRPRV